MANQGPRKGTGGSTRQGIYCMTAGGKLLAFKNGQDADSVRQLLHKGLEEWAKLPDAERKAKSIDIKPTRPADPAYCRLPPLGGLVVNVYTRMLAQNAKGELQDSEHRGPHGLKFGASRDHLWLTRTEWQSLIPPTPRLLDQLRVPVGITERIFRFHLIDNTRGEPPMWRKEEIRESRLFLTVDKVDDLSVHLRLNGTVLLSTSMPAASSARGYEAALLGHVQYDRKKQVISQFSAVALGDHWGRGTYTGGARPGRTPLGVAFELASGTSCADRVPPQGAREVNSYFGSGQR